MKYIKLTKDQIAIVDNEDYRLICENQWYAQKIRDAYYAARRPKKQKIIYMHRLILENKLDRPLEKNEFVDHINRNGLDNRRDNLRIATRSQNQMNKKTQGKFKYKGVSRDKNRKRWRARITFNKHRIHLGCFNDEIKAAKAYDEAAKKYFGEFARLNFGGKNNG